MLSVEQIKSLKGELYKSDVNWRPLFGVLRFDVYTHKLSYSIINTQMTR